MTSCWLEIERGLVVRRIERREVQPMGGHGLVEGACPGCDVTPFRIVGQRVDEDEPDVRKSGAYCVDCRDPVGYVYARGWDGTIFGAEEDRAMTTMARARVYGMEVPRG